MTSDTSAPVYPGVEMTEMLDPNTAVTSTPAEPVSVAQLLNVDPLEAPAAAAPADPAADSAVKTKGKKKEPKKPKEPKETKPRGQGIGAYACELLMARKTNQEVLDAVRAKFPDATTQMSSIAWYRNNLRVNGHNVPTARELMLERNPQPAEMSPEERKAAKAAAKAAKAEAKEADPTAASAEVDPLA